MVCDGRKGITLEEVFKSKCRTGRKISRQEAEKGPGNCLEPFHHRENGDRIPRQRKGWVSNEKREWQTEGELLPTEFYFKRSSLIYLITHNNALKNFLRFASGVGFEMIDGDGVICASHI
jgi:hypothetical protein